MKLKSWLNIAGIFNIVLGIIMFLISRLTIIPVAFLILSGFYYRTFFDNEDAYKNKAWLVILGIFNLIFNLVSGIIVLEVFGLLKEEKYCIDKEMRKKTKINSILQLGVVLVILSGIMIATNQTLEIPDILKVGSLLLLSGIFFFLSYMSKKYLKLNTSFKTYFILGMSFIIIGFIGLYCYNLLGSMSLDENNYLFFYPLLFLLASLCSIVSAKVLDIKVLNNISAYLVFVSLFAWFNALELNIVTNLLIMTFTCTLINCVYKPSCYLTKIVTDTSYILSLALVAINFIAVSANEFNLIGCLLLLLTTLNIFHLLVIKKNNILNIVSIPTLILNSILVVFMNNEMIEIEIVIFQVMMILFYNLIKLIKLEDLNTILMRLNRILFNLTFILTSIIALFVDNTAALFVSSLMILQNIVGLINKEKEERYLEPIKSLLFSISLIAFINTNFNLDSDLIFNLFILEMIQLVLYLIIKNQLIKKIHYGLYFGFIGLIALISLSTDNLFLALIALVSSLIPILVAIMKSDESLFVLIFSVISLTIINTNIIFEEIYYLNYLFAIILMIFYVYLNKDKKTNKYIVLFGIAANMLSFINIVNLDNSVYTTVSMLIFVYLALVITSLFEKQNEKDIFMSFALSIICLFNILTDYMLVSITISIITILMVIFGYIKDFKKLKIIGIILFILNLIYLLRDFWKVIPLAVYLLVIGLALIGIVIVKEIKENK